MTKFSLPRIFLATSALGATVLGAVFLVSCGSKEGAKTASTPAQIKVIDTIFVPGADDKLHPQKVSSPTLDTQLKSGGNPTPALDELIKLSPKWFPKDARVEDVKDNGSTITLLMSPEFANAKHWGKGENLTETAVYALVNTLAKDGKKVAFTIEGKPMTTLGEFDLSEPIEADPSLNAAKSGGKTSETDAKPAAKSDTSPSKTGAPTTSSPTSPASDSPTPAASPSTP